MLGRMLVLVAALVAGGVGAQEYYGDLRPDAPELAARGALQVGVRTLVAENKDQLDILRYSAEQPNPRYTRKLTLEVWYPARLAEGQKEHTVYSDVLGSGPNDPKRPNTPFQFNGRAARDAAPLLPAQQAAQAASRPGAAGANGAVPAQAAAAPSGRYPLVIVSHGYPGSRLQMSYLTENLASKGYVVVAIDHPESTRADKAGFASTLLNRRLDDLFVLNTVAGWAKPGSGNFLAGVVDADNTALIGYSMGGYGALNTVGAGVGAAAAAFVPGGKLAINQQGNQEYETARDPRIKAVVAFAPWGANYKVWDDAGLAGVRTPTLFITGDQDDVAGYKEGVLQIFQKTVNANRYLLTYIGGRHNSAPNPPSPAHYSNADDFQSYSEPVWDSRRINNINQHFVTAFLGVELKQQPLQGYLQLTPQSNDEWKGFSKRNAVGLEWRHLPPQ
ncbi:MULTISPECIES: dienelactone hydrolase [unclassified Duganella]|uniref:alpha/beta hydrolase family protein n=1 Tax=unclassified Duganella TaxID=2636909 RepID=UPI000883464A|nr:MULTISPECIES: dienelactone hydrolase [unclassified Duganella]SDH19324.1 Alpha/beta hydrolase family protein [Duganella sp. OV458]SDK33389.1 Platelet-activating factor acetylhydrolase, isoform II [Duganella sp. OV510]